MIVGDLFVKLGIGGAKEAKKELGGVTDGMKKFRLMSVAVAGASLGMVAGLGKLTASSNAYGAALLGFGTLTGQSIKKLQEWQRAGREAHATNEEVAQSISSVNKAMAQIALGRNVPSGWAAISGAVGGIDYERAKGDTFYMMRQLQKYAKDFKNLSGGLHAEGNAIDFLKSFGLTDNVITGMMRGVFNKKNFAKANLYTDWETQRLSKMKSQWATMFDGVEKSIGRLNVKFSKELLGTFEASADKLIKVLDGIGKSLQWYGEAFGWLKKSKPKKTNKEDLDELSMRFFGVKASMFPKHDSKNSPIKQTINLFFTGDKEGKLSPSEFDKIKKTFGDAMRQSNSQSRGN